MIVRAVRLCLCLIVPIPGGGLSGAEPDAAFMNFETAPVHPIALSPDRSRLVVCNLADGKLEVFDATTAIPLPLGGVPVGMDPVSVRFRNNDEAWVVNHVSDSISVVDIATLRVVATIDTLDTPADVVFAGSPERAFVSCALPNTLHVFDPVSRQVLTNLVINAERPKALAVSPDGLKVYAAVFESGNATTLVGAKFRNLLFFDNAVSRTNGPYGGRNPPPNRGDSFDPPLNPALPTNVPPPATGIIVRKSAAGRWLDDNQRDWTEFVSGTNAALTQRVPGWDLPDRDLAIIDTADFSIRYATGLMNICMALEANPASGRVAVVGTDSMNETRFEPNLNGIFVRVKLAMIDPLSLDKSVRDLNPHLDYLARTLPAAERDLSIGDPRAVAWTRDGARGYVAGMGSRNLIVIDADGNRLRQLPIEVGEGPCGLVIDEGRQRLYVFNRFSSSVSVVDTATESVIHSVSLFDPTPVAVAAGRRHLYDTRRTSGLGQAACASCHVDARMDRLAWDLGNPAGGMESLRVNHLNLQFQTNDYHPMKGVMLTQTLQDIIGHEPFHWRGDRPDLESFNGTFTNLQAAPSPLAPAEMREFREFLASILFPPNPHRLFDNGLSTNVPLPGHVALGGDVLPAGTPLLNGNAVAGLAAFQKPGNFCVSCHTLPTGLGQDAILSPSGLFTNIPPGSNGGRHFPLAFRLEGPLRSKIAQFRNMAERVGMESSRLESRAGFGFGHDGSVDSLTRFLLGVRIVQDQEIADLIALMLSVSGADTLLTSASGAGTGQPGPPHDRTPPSAAGRQLTVNSPAPPPLLDAMLALARSPTSGVDLIAKGTQEGLPRGWLHVGTNDWFQSDRQSEALSPAQLMALAAPGSEITFTVVPKRLGVRLGIDRDLDGIFDRDELDTGANPSDQLLRPRILAESREVPVGSDLQLVAQLPPWPAAGKLVWSKYGALLAAETNSTLSLGNVSFADAGEYRVSTITPFETNVSAPFRLSIVPLLANVAPVSQTVRRNSNALFTASVTGVGPFAFRWQFDGQDLAGATNNSLTVSNVQVLHEGIYRVIASNPFGALTSAPARLGVLVSTTVLVPPLAQRVVEGGDATFSVMIDGHPPPFGYQLRLSSTLVTNYVSEERAGFLKLFNVRPENAGAYRLVITNAATPALTIAPLPLTVLSDFDHDGLPDEWEAQHGLGTNQPGDAALDFDFDGQSNGEEYLAGTDPNDAQSYFRIERLFLSNASQAAVVEFNAVANRTYTLQSRETFFSPGWSRLADIVAFPTNRLVTITNSVPGQPARYYRLVTPQAP